MPWKWSEWADFALSLLHSVKVWPIQAEMRKKANPHVRTAGRRCRNDIATFSLSAGFLLVPHLAVRLRRWSLWV